MDRTAETADLAISAEELALLEKYENLPTGTHAYTVDSKGRVSIPAEFRSQLGEQFCICPSFDFSAVALYSTLAWVKLRDGYEKMGLYNRSVKRYLEQFDALTYRRQECDTQGRVLLPAKIRKVLLNDAKDVEVIGADGHISVRGVAKEEDRRIDFMNDMNQILDDIDSLEQQMRKENPLWNA